MWALDSSPWGFRLKKVDSLNKSVRKNRSIRKTSRNPKVRVLAKNAHFCYHDNNWMPEPSPVEYSASSPPPKSRLTLVS